MLRAATSLADRGAIYAANREFLRVMRMITQSLDSQLGRQYHTRALAAGLRALEEAEDFSLAMATASKMTCTWRATCRAIALPSSRTDLDQMTPLRAIQRYYEYAREQLTIAAGNTRLGSQALYALGRAEMFLGKEKPIAAPGAPKSIAFFHAALSADPQNVRAGNELAVMLARRGRLQDAAHCCNRACRFADCRRHQQPGDDLRTAGRSALDHDATAGRPTRRRQIGARGRPVARVTWVDPEAFAAATVPASETGRIARRRSGKRTGQRRLALPHDREIRTR